ncbi:Molybdate metabolism regulator [Enhygromyxa salina]|uniref:Molybdate metabolism regulator n=1 Tax=Enhygromyxa salina TaxID=215803 RepID=A0A0C2D167_9BACT|nr:WGR domain-containing protein [Enhygromyxa salina]KIG13892.1 Molybdate metabolism regulator [Enhygromyxa salina]
MRRFEFKDSRSYKFWEIEVDGATFTARYGKVGTDGQTQTKSFASPDKAAAAAEKKIQEKVRKGYAEVGSAPAPAPKQDAADESQEFAVLADKLLAAGDPWGQRIALAIAHAATAAKSPERRKLAKEIKQLERDHAAHFFGDQLHALMQEDGFEKIARLTWEHGYIKRAVVGVPEYGFDGPNAAEVLAAVMASPASEHLEQLTVGLTDFDGGGLRDAHQAIAAGIVHPHLDTVFIGDFSADEQEVSWVDHGDVSGLYAKAPKLRTLRLRGAGIELGKLEHPTLARLEIESGGLPEASVVSLANAKLPELVHIEVWFGRTDYGGTTNIAALRPLFSTKTLPKLKHLGLQNSEMQDEIAVELAKSKLLAQVDSVDLSMGTMRGAGAQAIIDHAQAFKHLKSLNLSNNYIPGPQRAQLHAALDGIVKLGRQDTPESYDGTDYYYTSVGE